MLTARDVELPKSLSAGVTRIWMMPAATGTPDGSVGAVYTTLACPLASVTRLRAERDPRVVVTVPLTETSARSETLRSGEMVIAR